MYPENRITRGVETAARITDKQGLVFHGHCDHCACAVRGMRSTVSETYRGAPYSALVCQACVAKYLVPNARSAAPAAERAKFWDALGQYRTAVPRRDTAPAAAWRAEVDRARAALDALGRSPHAHRRPAVTAATPRPRR